MGVRIILLALYSTEGILSLTHSTSLRMLDIIRAAAHAKMIMHIPRGTYTNTSGLVV